jgi:hypothetical protein
VRSDESVLAASAEGSGTVLDENEVMLIAQSTEGAAVGWESELVEQDERICRVQVFWVDARRVELPGGGVDVHEERGDAVLVEDPAEVAGDERREDDLRSAKIGRANREFEYAFAVGRAYTVPIHSRYMRCQDAARIAIRPEEVRGEFADSQPLSRAQHRGPHCHLIVHVCPLMDCSEIECVRTDATGRNLEMPSGQE